MIKIQSFSDIITNSSSELFVFRSNESVKTLQKMIDAHYEKYSIYNLPEKERDFFEGDDSYNSCSGMGGEHKVIKFKEGDEYYYGCDIEKFRKYSKGDISDIFLLDIDWSSKATIEWFEENFTDVVRID